MKELTKLEELVMIAIWTLGENAYGVNIKKKKQDSLWTGTGSNLNGIEDFRRQF